MPVMRYLFGWMAALAVWLAPAGEAAAQACTGGAAPISTYTYTAATLSSPALLDIDFSVTCPSIYGTPPGQPVHLCVTSWFVSQATRSGSGESMPVSVRLTSPANTGLSPAVMAGPYPAGVASGGNIVVNGRVTVTAAANQAVSRSPGSYDMILTMLVEYADLDNGWPMCMGEFFDPGFQMSVWSTARFVIPGSCSIASTGTVGFGDLPAMPTTASNVDAQGSVGVLCSAATPYTVYLGDGLNRAGAGSGSRQMASGDQRLPYQLYRDANRTQVWNQAVGGGVSDSGTGAVQTLPVYGRIPAGTVLPAPGDYQDSVIVTVSY
ncbi:spore coat U domain-containing protein [Pigmentiphaga sp.]|uniref:Csu type fimbrial protein n=1 Tax=Pigmentiphaga sp. TaxID=1977564 RepID=UPI0025F0E908|nr:spore coat U domain-containing protein [Pigmentiphaga sp.]